MVCKDTSPAYGDEISGTVIKPFFQLANFTASVIAYCFQTLVFMNAAVYNVIQSFKVTHAQLRRVVTMATSVLLEKPNAQL